LLSAKISLYKVNFSQHLDLNIKIFKRISLSKYFIRIYLKKISGEKIIYIIKRNKLIKKGSTVVTQKRHKSSKNRIKSIRKYLLRIVLDKKIEKRYERSSEKKFSKNIRSKP
jgi:hypothetical protein